MLVGFVSIVLSFYLVACLAVVQQKSPDFTHKSVGEIIAAVSDGDKVALRSAFKQLSHSRQLRQAGDEIARIILNSPDAKIYHLAKLTYLYNLLPPDHRQAPEVFFELSSRDSKILRQVAWETAKLKPSARMTSLILRRVNSLIGSDNDEELFKPHIAEAIAANRVTKLYSVVRAGLMHNQHESFVRAMQELNPKRASSDFLDYLALASVDDLRQQSPTSVNILACVKIFEHLEKYPVSVHHRRFESLFWYAISRNLVFSEAAITILERYYGQHAGYLAQLLSRLPYWAQHSFVENLARVLTPLSRQFLVVLKQKTSGVDVIDEINQLIR
ncbi:MAG: hypothetical protein OYH77_00260 [Pseudomonadota bacterium]|nr:hypothetical protein [Pseudomonadota bacterium]